MASKLKAKDQLGLTGLQETKPEADRLVLQSVSMRAMRISKLNEAGPANAIECSKCQAEE